MSDHPEVIVEDHQTEHSLASEQHGDVPVEAVTPSQQYYVGMTLIVRLDAVCNLYKGKIYLLDMSNKPISVPEIVGNIYNFIFEVVQNIIIV